MKIKNLVVGTLLVGSLFTVGCQSTENNEDNYSHTCKYCGYTSDKYNYEKDNFANLKDRCVDGSDKDNYIENVVKWYNEFDGCHACKTAEETIYYFQLLDENKDVSYIVPREDSDLELAKEHIENCKGNHTKYEVTNENGVRNSAKADEFAIECSNCGKEGTFETFNTNDNIDYYCDDCWNLMQEAPTPEIDYNNAHCDNCGEVIPSDHIDSCGGYWCENCDYVK